MNNESFASPVVAFSLEHWSLQSIISIAIPSAHPYLTLYPWTFPSDLNP